MNLEIEIYEDCGKKCAYIGDDIGGSGIKVSATSYEEFAEEIGKYIADYAFSE